MDPRAEESSEEAELALRPAEGQDDDEALEEVDYGALTDDPDDAPDPEGTSIGCLGMMVLGGWLLAAIPLVGGLLAIIMGRWSIQWGRNERAEALRHVRKGPLTPIHQARVGEVVALLGKVASPAAHETPLGHHAALAALWIDDELGDSMEDALPGWTKQLGSSLLLKGEGGQVRIDDQPLRLLSEKTTTTTQTGGEPPPHAPLSNAERKALKGRAQEYGERWLEPGMEVIATGMVLSVGDAMATADAGYRGLAKHRAVRLGPVPDEGVVRLSTYSPRRIADLARTGKAQIVGGAIWIVTGVVSLLAWSGVLW